MRRQMWTAVLLAGCLLAGCSVATNGPSGGTLASGRTISAESDRLLRTIRCTALSPNTEAVAIGRRKLVIEPAAIQIDGTEVVPISAAARSVTVAERGGRLLVTADGQTVYDDEY